MFKFMGFKRLVFSGFLAVTIWSSKCLKELFTVGLGLCKVTETLGHV